MPRVNILKQIRAEDRWKLVSIPRDDHGRLNWKARASGRYFIEWWERGKRKRQAAGTTTAETQEAARRRKHLLEGKALGFEAYAAAGFAFPNRFGPEVVREFWNSFGTPEGNGLIAEPQCGFSRSFTQGFSLSFTHPWVFLLTFYQFPSFMAITQHFFSWKGGSASSP